MRKIDPMGMNKQLISFGIIIAVSFGSHAYPAMCHADEASDSGMLAYSKLRMLPHPRTVYATDFSGDFQYQVPHRNDTSGQAKLLENGCLTVRIRPGMHGASSDAPDRERAEYSHVVPLNALVRQSFRLRVDAGFAAPKRTMVAQIKPDPISPLSPPVSLYLSDQGAVKWVEYGGGKAKQDQHHVRLQDYKIDLLDGKWHSVSMEYLRSDDDGFCRVIVDEKVVVENQGYCSNPGGEHLNVRIGIYRDAMPIEQRVHYDDWSIKVLAEKQDIQTSDHR